MQKMDYLVQIRRDKIKAVCKN